MITHWLKMKQSVRQIVYCDPYTHFVIEDEGSSVNIIKKARELANRVPTLKPTVLKIK